MNDDSQDRIAVVKEEISRLQEQIEQCAVKIERKEEDIQRKGEEIASVSIDHYKQLVIELQQKDQLRQEKDQLRDKKDQLAQKLQQLRTELTKGEYFAKTDDIFARNKQGKTILKKLDNYEGAAGKIMRDSAPVGTDGGIYKKEIELLLERLEETKDDKSASVANMDSLATTSSSEYSAGEQSSIQGSTGEDLNPPAKQKDLVSKHISNSNNQSPKEKARACLIPGKPSGRGHQVPKGATCSTWWPLVCLWVIGKVGQLEEFYDKIKQKTDAEEQAELEKRLRGALIKLANGVKGGSPGIRSNPRNLLNVTKPHDEYYDAGYNWVIIPILTLDQMKSWKGESYEVAIFVGQHGAEMNSDKSDKDEYKYNRFKDGPTRWAAETAEMGLLGGIDESDIAICSQKDIEKITDVIHLFFAAFADLHTRSRKRNEDGTISGIDKLSPRQWGIIDLAPGVKKAFGLDKEDGKNEDGTIDDSDDGDDKLSTRQRGVIDLASGVEEAFKPGKKDGENEDGKSKDSKSKDSNMNQLVFDKSCSGIDAIIKTLYSDTGFSFPLPQTGTNCFNGKHVFKTPVRQSYPTDPILVATKGTVNLGRQFGIKFLPGCRPSKSDSESSSYWTSDEEHSLGTPIPTVSFTDLDIAVVTPDHSRKEAIGDDDVDACSDITAGDFYEQGKGMNFGTQLCQ